jgi:hypothetical protein
MNAVAEQPAKYKTTLYLTEENRQRLAQLPGGNMTALINEAIAEKLERLEREQARQTLLDSLVSGKRTPAKGVSTQTAVQNLREQAIATRVVY